MNKIKSKIIDAKQWLMHFVMVRFFRWSSKQRQQRLLCKHAGMFLAYNNLAKKYDDLGDLRTAMDINSDAYHHLGWFAAYCTELDIDQVKLLKEYAP